MPLTYQPFAEVPELETIARDASMNISETERVFSGVGGAGMIAAGLARDGWIKWAMIAIGAAFLRRGWTGHCPINERLKIDNRHPTRRAVKNRERELDSALEAY